MSMDLEQLQKCLSYDPETGVFTRINSARSDKIGKPTGTVGKNGYVYINVGKKLHLAHRLAWVFVHGVEPKGHIDHINRNRADNRIANLRECKLNQRDNAQNMSVQKHNTSGYTGVHWFKRTKKWQAYITVDGKRQNLGYYASVEEAARAYAEAKDKLHLFHGDVVHG